MKITFIIPYSKDPVGAYKVVYEYANRLSAKGHYVNLVHIRHFYDEVKSTTNYYQRLRRKIGDLLSFVTPHNITWHNIDRRVNLIYALNDNEKYIPDADIVVAPTFTIAESAIKYSSKKGKKFYLIQMYYYNGSDNTRLKITLRQPYKKIAINKWIYENEIKSGTSPNDIIYIPNGVDQRLYRVIEPIYDRPPQVAMLYSIAEFKGGADGVKALELTKNKFPQLQAVLFGTTKKPEWLPQWIKYIQNPPLSMLVEQIYNQSRIYLCPSKAEAWHLPPAEAMACGCAVVSTDIPGVRDYAIHNVTALLSAVGRPELLSDNLIKLLKHDDLRIELAKSGNKKIKEFTWEESTDKMEQYFSINILNH
ncbi:MAG: glycosyltransferase family 4 protein [Deltaproteobacteria bacterium]|nr:glycosyltransferase family 4 protein [Deltaproteobacteria bacterium]